jgi:hypothetical protein
MGRFAAERQCPSLDVILGLDPRIYGVGGFDEPDEARTGPIQAFLPQ